MKKNNFEFKNINPIEKRTGDCSIRAIALAENKKWIDIFDELVLLAKKEYTLPNDNDLIKKYLSKYEKINVKYEKKGKKKRYKPSDMKGWEGIFIVKLASHLTTVINGVCYDTWDCTDKSAYIIWKVK